MWCGNCFVDCINAGAQSIPLEELMQQSWDFRSEIEQAAAIEGGKYVAACAAANLAEAGRSECERAAASGTTIKVTQFVKVLDGSEDWPCELADLLIQTPELATESNGTLCVLLSKKLGVAIDKQRLSRKLTKKVRLAVIRKLTDAGYDSSAVESGTDIKRSVAGVKHSAAIPFAGETEFYADGVRIDGTKLSYMLRQRAVLTGNAWQDFCVKVAGDFVNLTVLLRMRRVSIGEFQAADARALAAADDDALARREDLRRARQAVPRSVDWAQPDAPELAVLARTWWHELSPAKKATAGFWEMAHHVRSVSADPIEAAEAKRRLDAWADRWAETTSGEQAPTHRCGDYVEQPDGTLADFDSYLNPYADAGAFEAVAA
jgi:hypothetical protein